MIDFADLGTRLSVAVRESPGNGIADEELRDYYRKANGERIWEIWTQCLLFDEKDRQRMFSTYSGLPTGVVNRYMEVCQKYQEDRVIARIKASKKKTASKKIK